MQPTTNPLPLHAAQPSGSRLKRPWFRRALAMVVLAGIPASLSAQCLSASSGGAWTASAFTAQAGTFTATFDATPSASPDNAVVTLSNGAPTAYTSCAFLVRFNTSGTIDAYNGSTAAYAGSGTTFSGGSAYHFRVVASVAAQTYSVYVTPPGGSEQTVGTNFGFRVAAASLDHEGLFVAASGSGGVGTLNVCNFTVSSGSSCPSATVDGAWNNASMAAQSGSFTATFDATPSASPNNAVVTLSNGAQTAYTGCACLVRFNTSGTIDAYNGTGYAGSGVGYSGGFSYHFRLVVNVGSQTYSVYVTPPGGSEQAVGTGFAFRVAASTLNDWGIFVAPSASGGVGTLTVCNFSTTAAVATPVFTPGAGTYSSAQTVSITSTTSGASIRYTTDGSTPTSSAGTLYSGPVAISSTATLKAIAFKSGMADSAVASGTYTISALNPNLPPGENFDLTHWTLMLPSGSAGHPTVITQPQLQTYTDSHFYSDSSDGAMTFFVPENGFHSTNSSYPRSELHEEVSSGDWSLSGSHTLQATVKVEDTVGTVTIGQIHLSDPGKPLLELQYHSNGQVSAFIEVNPDGTNTPPATTITTVPLNTKFSYTVQVHNSNQLTITVAGVQKTFTINSSYNASTFYFKAGAYLQTTGSSSSVGAHVAFYSLKTVHQ